MKEADSQASPGQSEGMCWERTANLMRHTSGYVGLLHALAMLNCPCCVAVAEAGVHVRQHAMLQQADCNPLQAGAFVPHCT